MQFNKKAMMFESFVMNELKQMKIEFPQDDEMIPDNMKQMAQKYIKNRVAKPVQKTVSTWEDCHEYMSSYVTAIPLLYDQMVLTDEIITDIENEIQETGSYYNDTFKQYLDVFTEYNEDEDNIEEYMQWDRIRSFINWLVEKRPSEIEQVLNFEYNNMICDWLYDKQGNEKAEIYRAITLPNTLNDIEDIQYEGVGICWSYVYNGAEAYYGDSRHINTAIMTASIEPSDINIRETLRKSLWTSAEEKEIELNAKTTIEITQIEISTRHPKAAEIYKNNLDYFEPLIGVQNAYKVARNPSSVIVTFDEPITVKTS